MLVYQRVSWGPYFPKPCHLRHTDLVDDSSKALPFRSHRPFWRFWQLTWWNHIEARKQTMSWKPHKGDQQFMYIYVYLFIIHIYAHIWRWKMFQLTCYHSWKLFHHQSFFVDVSRWLLLMDSWNFMNIAILVGKMYDMNHQNWGVPCFQMCLQCDAPVQPPQPPCLRPFSLRWGRGEGVGLSPGDAISGYECLIIHMGMGQNPGT